MDKLDQTLACEIVDANGGTVRHINVNVQKCLGKGTVGQVFSVLSVGETVAMKRVKWDSTETLAADRLGKLSRLCDLDHKNIIRTMYIARQADPALRMWTLIFQELCEGDLYGPALEGDLDEQTKRLYTAQILTGLRYLHSLSLIHGDLKTRNIFLAQNGAILKIGDLDDYIRLQGTYTQKEDVKDMQGTPVYMSPEMLKKESGDQTEGLVGRKTDIWSLGCVVLDLMCVCAWKIGQHGVRRIDIYQIRETYDDERFIREDSAHPEIPSNLNNACEQFIKACFRRNTGPGGGRPSAEELLEFNFVKNLWL